jgi:hypothetical protein
MTLMTKPQSDQLLVVTKRTIPACLILTCLSTLFSYPVYADGLSSEWPWKISALLTFVCCLGPLLIYFRYRGTNALCAYGMVILVGLFAAYYLFGFSFYFYFFMFSPISAYLKWPGLIVGITLTAFWIVITRRNVLKTIHATPFVKQAFEDWGDHFGYRIQKGVKVFERCYKELNPFPQFLMYMAYGIAPFYLILNRLLSSTFGSTGVLFFVAALSMPVSLWLIGVLVRGYLVMVALPLRIQKEQHKRVVVME